MKRTTNQEYQAGRLAGTISSTFASSLSIRSNQRDEESMAKPTWRCAPITFSEADLDLKSYPHKDAFIIEANIDSWQIKRVLVDNGSQIDIIFYETFKRMGFEDEDLKQSSLSLYGFRSKRIVPVVEVTLPVSFGNTSNS